MNCKGISFLLLATIVAIPAVSSDALDIAGNHLVLPIVARTPGAFGSQWQTDIVVTNTSRRLNPIPVTITFHSAGRDPISLDHQLQPRGSLALHDVVRQTFGLEDAAGLVIVQSAAPNAKLSARARIYNVGGWQGEFGQTSQGVPQTMLGREIYLSGLRTGGVNRTNVGVANPGDVEANVFISLFTEEGEFAGGFSTTIQPKSVLQFNDIFSVFQSGPHDDATILLSSSSAVYGYGSVVRSDSGDADFVTGIGGDPQINEVITPSCESPAPLQIAPGGWEAEGWIVGLGQELDAQVVSGSLASKYGFTVLGLYETLPAFRAELTHEQIAQIRCEAGVTYVQQNQYVPIP